METPNNLESGIGSNKRYDLLTRIVDKIMNDSQILCFDEFQVLHLKILYSHHYKQSNKLESGVYLYYFIFR